MTSSLDGRVAIVTGGSGGIGSATCRALAARGARIVVADIMADQAQALAEELNDNGHEAIAVAVDLADEDQIRTMIRQTINAFGRLDILDNNAALLSAEMARADGDIAHMDTEVWDAAFSINTRGTMISCREALKIMTDQKSGSIINTASNLALQGNVIQAAYSASKAAVIQMTRSIATSHGKSGIRCNAVLPGLTGTESALSHLPQELVSIVTEETLTPFLGQPMDIAHLVVFLASDEARYITGQAIAADGGTSIHIPGVARLREFINRQV